MTRSAKDHGTLDYFKCKLGRVSVNEDPKKDIDGCKEFLNTVLSGHLVACACSLLGIDSPESTPSSCKLDPMLYKKSKLEKQAYLNSLSKEVVKRCTLIKTALTSSPTPECSDKVYCYSRLLCHYSSLLLEFGVMG